MLPDDTDWAPPSLYLELLQGCLFLTRLISWWEEFSAPTTSLYEVSNICGGFLGYISRTNIAEVMITSHPGLQSSQYRHCVSSVTLRSCMVTSLLLYTSWFGRGFGTCGFGTRCLFLHHWLVFDNLQIFEHACVEFACQCKHQSVRRFVKLLPHLGTNLFWKRCEEVSLLFRIGPNLLTSWDCSLLG